MSCEEQLAKAEQTLRNIGALTDEPAVQGEIDRYFAPAWL